MLKIDERETHKQAHAARPATKTNKREAQITRHTGECDVMLCSGCFYCTVSSHSKRLFATISMDKISYIQLLRLVERSCPTPSFIQCMDFLFIDFLKTDLLQSTIMCVDLSK